MKYQLLVAAMHQTDDSILERMKISSDAIIINQCDAHGFHTTRHKGHEVLFYSFQERGVGLSRNSALMRSSADIIEFADEDMILVDGYEQLVLSEFEKHPEADAILFRVDSLNPERPVDPIRSFNRVGVMESRKYGCARLAVRREKILYHNLSFSLLFGGGAKYSCGEDTLFVKSMIDHGLRVYKSPVKIADVKQDGSSWFHGYTDKYYADKGALMQALYGPLSIFAALLMAVKNSKLQYKSFCRILKNYRTGIRDYKTRC